MQKNFLLPYRSKLSEHLPRISAKNIALRSRDDGKHIVAASLTIFAQKLLDQRFFFDFPIPSVCFTTNDFARTYSF
jgi:hypothetical protein